MMMNYKTIVKYYIVGGYKGMKDKYNKRITPFFDSYLEAMFYRQNNGMFSLSLSEGSIKTVNFYI